jgi:hypothetical protein
MGGDYTRWTFDPTKDYKSVFKQQGRVDLDADWNEFVEITDRRWRTESMDIAGQDFVSEITPDAFLITPAGVDNFSIGIGRLYVDGLVAECHGLPPAQFDPILGEIEETKPVLYSNQPYLPAPLPPPIGAPNTTDLIYLDVWEREINAIQDPNIREKALAGPDTCTRLQTVWQVRDLPNVGQHACGDDIQAWDALIAPSASRLTTSTVPPNPSATPCILSQTGGYTGLENRLYRVEVHVAGTVGGANPAQFKWSRDNASIVASVSGISASGGTNSLLNVSTLGRDSVLRFNVGDWVEVLDDYCEFQSEFTGASGFLTKIIATDAASVTLTVNPPVPAAPFNFNPGDATRHTRVRRWDGRADLNSDVNATTGLIPVSTGPIDLEQGIQVSFSADPVGGSLKVGDYWIFAARTFDASVEPLVSAPPRGILHHYCRLAFIAWDANGNGTVSDCRPTHGKCDCGGDCSATVGDGVNSIGQFTDIQAAINSLGPAGGVVCVGRGVYEVTTTITINPGNGPVTLLGMGAATHIVFTPGANSGSVLLQISRTDHIRVQGFFMAARSATALIGLDTCSFCVIRDCTLVNLGIAPAQNFGLASSSFASSAGSAPSSAAIVTTGRCVRCDIKENALLAAKGILGAVVQDLCIRDNDFLAFHGAIFLSSANGLEIQYNLMRGLSAASLKNLQGSIGPNGLASSVTAFQAAVTQAFTSPSGSQFMGTGVFLLTGFDVNVSHNRIVAQAGIVTVLLVEGAFEGNELLAFMGFFALFSILVRVANNLVAGLLMGYAQAGIVIDFVCEANFFLGFAGVVFFPFSAFLDKVAAALGTGLANASIVANAANVLNAAQAAGASSAGSLQSFGLAATVKIHRNDFFTFLYGVAKFDQFLSADFSIIDNSFALCHTAGILLSAQLGDALGSGWGSGSSTLATTLAKFFSLRHLIQSNSIVVTGTGIITQCPETFIRDNTISAPSAAADVSAAFCDLQNNFIYGDPTQNLPSSALIQLEIHALDARVRGNRLLGGPGSGIALVSRTVSVQIEDNEIVGMAQNGITSVDNSGFFQRLSVCRNTISRCAGGAAGGTFWHSGAIVLADLVDAQIVGNTISGNQTPAAAIDAHAIYVATTAGADISGNQIFGNFVAAPVAGNSTAGIEVLAAQAELLIHGNRVTGNGGGGITVLNLDQDGSVSIHHNHVDNTSSAAANSALYLVAAFSMGFLNVEDNMCFYSAPAQGVFGFAVLTFASYTNATGNTIRVKATGKMLVRALAAEALSTATGNVMITSNTLLGGYATNLPAASPLLIVANNFIG